MSLKLSRWINRNIVTPTYPDDFKRWQTRNLITPVGRVNSTLTLPAFTIAAGTVDRVTCILAVFNFYSPNIFSILNKHLLSVSGYSLFITHINSDHTVYRYYLAGDVIPAYDYETYQGQPINHFFRLEVWGDELSGVTQSTDLTLTTSVKLDAAANLAAGSLETNMQSLTEIGEAGCLPFTFADGAQPAYN